MIIIRSASTEIRSIVGQGNCSTTVEKSYRKISSKPAGVSHLVEHQEKHLAGCVMLHLFI